MTAPLRAAAALFRQDSAVIEAARQLIDRDHAETSPRDVRATWLGIGTCLIAWNDADGKPHTMTVTGDDARTLHDAEGGSPSFPPRCRGEHEVDGQIVVCRLRSPHYPLHHSNNEGVTWP